MDAYVVMYLFCKSIQCFIPLIFVCVGALGGRHYLSIGRAKFTNVPAPLDNTQTSFVLIYGSHRCLIAFGKVPRIAADCRSPVYNYLRIKF